MDQQRLIYRYYRYNGKELQAKREIPFEFKITARLMFDELCYTWNKAKVEEEINLAIDEKDHERFIKLSKKYIHYIKE